jgi:hypothetical protein
MLQDRCPALGARLLRAQVAARNPLEEPALQRYSAETSALGALNGTGTMQDTVSHMMMAERQLQQAIAVRDKLVSAYMDLTRMQI